MADDPHKTPSLDDLRARIDEIDTELVRLIEERAALPKQVAKAKAASGDSGAGFGLRPGREAEIVRRLLSLPREHATPTLIVRIWRELMGHSLAAQGPFDLSVWGGRDPARAAELARQRFGGGPTMKLVEKPEDAIAGALRLGGVGVLALVPDSAWWGRLLAQPRLKVFAALPCLAAWGPTAALAVSEVEVDPTGGDNTFWVTDAGGPAQAIEDHFSRDGVAATLIAEAGGLRLFALSGFYQPQDDRIARAPGRLSGVIGAAPAPFDV